MSLPGKDLKQQIPAEIHAVLKAYAETHEKTIQEVVIEVLGRWADRQIGAVTLMHHKLRVAEVISDRQGAGTNVRLTRIVGEAD